MFDEKLFAIKRLGLENQEKKEWVYTILDELGFDLLETVASTKESEVVLQSEKGIKIVMDTKSLDKEGIDLETSPLKLDDRLIFGTENYKQYKERLKEKKLKKYISVRVISEEDNKINGRLTFKFTNKDYEVEEIDGYLLYNNGSDSEMYVFSGQYNVAMYDANSLNAYEIIAQKPISEEVPNYNLFKEYCIFPETSTTFKKPIASFFKFSNLITDYANKKTK